MKEKKNDIIKIRKKPSVHKIHSIMKDKITIVFIGLLLKIYITIIS